MNRDARLLSEAYDKVQSSSLIDKYPVLVVWSSDDGSIKAYGSKEEIYKAIGRYIGTEDDLYGAKDDLITLKLSLFKGYKPGNLIHLILDQFERLGPVEEVLPDWETYANKASDPDFDPFGDS